MIGRNDPCWCGSGIKWKKCHWPTEAEVNRDDLRKEAWKKYKILLKTEEQLEGIRRSCHLAAKILDTLCSHAQAGVTTQELDDLAVKLHKSAGATAAPLGYGDPPFPKSICTSINEVICHGIPGKYRLQEGDILNIDVTCILDGYYGDCSQMVMIGNVSPERRLVVDVSYECLMRAIAAVKPGGVISDIGNAIETYALKMGCSVAHQFVGHGVGVGFHEAPQVPHFQNKNNTPLLPGMTFTIEPMINAGEPEAVIDPADEWTARTIDGKASAQWEHTLAVTESGCEILTPWVRKKGG
jgi:methionyl aminopeptidase